MILINGIIFWFIITFWIVMSVYLIEEDKYDTNGRANTLFTTVLSVLIFFLIGGKHYDWPDINWSLVIIFSCIYFIIGFFWSIFKWVSFIMYKFKYQTYHNIELEKPLVSDYKGNIIAWIAWWPFSLIRFILSDLLIISGDYLMKILGSVYTSITNKIYNGK